MYVLFSISYMYVVSYPGRRRENTWYTLFAHALNSRYYLSKVGRSTNGHLNHIKGTTKGCIAQPQNLISIDPGVWPEKP